MELERQAIRVGNSSGVLLPKKYYGRRIKIEIIEDEPKLSEVIEILEKNEVDISEIKSIILSGSYATNEVDLNSDIDILIITENKNEYIKSGNYEIVLYPEKYLLNSKNKKIMKNNLIIKSMIKSGKPLFNKYKYNHILKIGVTKKEKLGLIKENDKVLKSFNESLKYLEDMTNDNYLRTQVGIVSSGVLRIRMLLSLLNLYSKKKMIKELGSNVVSQYKKIKSSRSILKSKNKLSLAELKNIVTVMDKINKKWQKNQKLK